MELYESRLANLKEIGTINHNIVFVAKLKELGSNMSLNSNKESYLVRKIKKILKSNNFDKRQANRLLRKKKVRCFNCDEEHCPKHKKN